MIQDLPQNAKQLTADRELYKITLEEGNKINRLSNLNDTCVAVFYIIKTGDEDGNEIVDFTNDDDIVAWIVGDKESEASIYPFLQIGVKAMCEGETSKFIFTRKYLLGDVPIVNSNGRIFQSKTFSAIVKLIKSQALSQIKLSPEPKEKNKNSKPLLQLKDESNQEKAEETTPKDSNLEKEVKLEEPKQENEKKTETLSTDPISKEEQNQEEKTETIPKNANQEKELISKEDPNQEKKTESTSKNTNQEKKTETTPKDTNQEKELPSKEDPNQEKKAETTLKSTDQEMEPTSTDSKQETPQEAKLNDSTNQNEKQSIKSPNDEAFIRRKYAINQLKTGELFLNQKRPAFARKEFNKARITWTSQADLSKAPETISHSSLDLPDDEFKKYVFSRALYGVARTFLEIEPPNTEKAVMNLRESIEVDPDFLEAKMMLETLGQKVDEDQFPELEDKRLTMQKYWLNPDVEWSKRVEYSVYVKDKATSEFKQNNFKTALDLYKRCIISFSGQSKNRASLTKEQISTMNKTNIISKLNCLACYLSMKDYKRVITHADELLDTITKMEPTIIEELNNSDQNIQNDDNNNNENTTNTTDTNQNNTNTSNDNKIKNETCENYKLKCLYRKALALNAINMTEQFENTIKQIQKIDGSDTTIQAIRKKQKEDEILHQPEKDEMLSKIAMTLK